MNGTSIRSSMFDVRRTLASTSRLTPAARQSTYFCVPNSHLALLAREPFRGKGVLLSGCSRQASGTPGPVLLAGGRPGAFREWVLTKAGTSRLAQWQSTRLRLWESQVRILYQRRGVKPAPDARASTKRPEGGGRGSGLPPRDGARRLGIVPASACGPGRESDPVAGSLIGEGAARLDALKCVDSAGRRRGSRAAERRCGKQGTPVRPQRQKLSGVRGNLPAQTALRGRACDRPCSAS